MSDRALLQIDQPGMMTTVQDLGRPGLARFGVAPGGAMDRAALILGNRLIANDPGTAALEVTLIGPKLRVGRGSFVAITGGDLGARLNDQPAPLWQPFRIGPGDAISFDPSCASLGARAYVCIAGGIDIDPVMGSRSTDLIGGFGGWHGRPLQSGDELPVGQTEAQADTRRRRLLTVEPPSLAGEFVARVVLGPQADRFTAAGIATLLGSTYSVSSKSNRQGVRLNGPWIEHTSGADLISEGIAHGAIQVPGDGQPIVLLAGRQTVGGYVKIATVIGADLDRFGQLRPGDTVRFESVSVQEARTATLAYRTRLGPEAVIDSQQAFHPMSNAGVEAPRTGSEIAELAGVWDPDGVIRVIDALDRAGASDFSIEVDGLSLKLRRGQSGWTSDTKGEPGPGDQNDLLVTAPVLGVFYRRSNPDQPLLVDEGASVTAGQVIGLIEVMKTYHEVTAPRDGKLAAFFVKDGQFVEYGQPIARIEK